MPVRKLPVDEKFLIYVDDDGDYIIQAQRQKQSQYLSAHGRTPSRAVFAMIDTLELVDKTLKASKAHKKVKPLK